MNRLSVSQGLCNCLGAADRGTNQNAGATIVTASDTLLSVVLPCHTPTVLAGAL